MARKRSEKSCIVVTGGTGFIGRAILYKLEEYAADLNMNLISVSRAAGTPFPPDKNITHISADLRVERLIDVLPGIRPNYIYHCAGISGGIHYLQSIQAEVLQSNLAILMNSVSGIEKFPLKGQVWMSSVCAYPQEVQRSNKIEKVSLREDMTSINPDSTYGMVKIVGEQLFYGLATEKRIPGCSIRLFNTYGPGEHFDDKTGHVIPSLIRKAWSSKKSIDVLGDGKQVRSFLYIDDAVEAIISASAKLKRGEIVNVGSDVPITIGKLAEHINEIVSMVSHNPKKKIVFSTKQAPGAVGRFPDIKLAQKLLDWSPTTSIEDGLVRTCRWYNERP